MVVGVGVQTGELYVAVCNWSTSQKLCISANQRLCEKGILTVHSFPIVLKEITTGGNPW